MDKPELQIIGENGNAFLILGKAEKSARKAGWSKEKIKEFFDKATSGDYNNLLNVCSEYFEVS